MKSEPSVVQSIRLPRKLWDEIQKQAEVTDRSFNHIVNKILKAHLEQEAQTKKESRAI